MWKGIPLLKSLRIVDVMVFMAKILPTLIHLVPPSLYRPRDEAASATVRGRNRTYAIGGMGERTVEFIDMSDFVMSASGDDDADFGTGIGEPAVFDARYA